PIWRKSLRVTIMTKNLLLDWLLVTGYWLLVIGYWLLITKKTASFNLLNQQPIPSNQYLVTNNQLPITSQAGITAKQPASRYHFIVMTQADDSPGSDRAPSQADERCHAKWHLALRLASVVLASGRWQEGKPHPEHKAVGQVFTFYHTTAPTGLPPSSIVYRPSSNPSSIIHRASSDNCASFAPPL
ncbi:MAG: hypothetical protein NZP34_12730, partial [Caldilineales bacterium]|nr:hypothetical protein [Caldilineales bacterium]